MHKFSKILIVITQSSWGGAQKYAYELASGIKDEAEVVVCGGKDTAGEMTRKLQAANIRFIPLKNLVRNVNPVKDLIEPWEIKKLIEKEKPDIVHLNSSKASIVGTIGAFLSRHKAKVVYTCHGWVFNEALNPGIRILYLILEKITGRLKDLVICLSDKDMSAAKKFGIASGHRLVKIHNGIAAIAFLEKSEARTILNLGQDEFIIGSIGNFYKNKGFDMLIEAAASISRPVKFAIIGDGELKSELAAKIKEKGLEDKFLLLGKIENASRFLKAFDIYACSSIKEGFPYTILEAMSAGLPIASTDVGGISEVIKESNGILCQVDATSISDALQRLMDDPQLRSDMSGKNVADASENFSLEKSLRNTLEAYDRLLG